MLFLSVGHLRSNKLKPASPQRTKVTKIARIAVWYTKTYSTNPPLWKSANSLNSVLCINACALPAQAKDKPTKIPTNGSKTAFPAVCKSTGINTESSIPTAICRKSQRSINRNHPALSSVPLKNHFQ